MNGQLSMTYTDDRSRVILGEQTENLLRVSGRIGISILAFFRVFSGKQFTSATLHAFIADRCGAIAPGSADRVMRDMGRRKIIRYRLVDRRRSLYEAL